MSRRQERPRPAAAIPDGQRVYAVGDIHGRLDLFRTMIELIERDDSECPHAQTTVILLGDLVDRGPDSRGVIEAARMWRALREVRILLGNHEEMLLASLERTEVLRHFLRHGGRETVLSYGMDQAHYHAARLEEVQEVLRQNLPRDHIDFISSFEDQVIIGDYLFVHAGILPDMPLDQQKQRDLRWIREPFLSHPEPFSHVVVHGHSICEEPEDLGNRIGIDTGAYDSGVLTALVLEGDQRRFLHAREAALPA